MATSFRTYTMRFLSLEQDLLLFYHNRYVHLDRHYRQKIYSQKESKIMRNSEDNVDSIESYRNWRNSTKVYKIRMLQMMKLFEFIITANILLWIPSFFLAICCGILGNLRIHTVVYSIAYFSLLSGIVIHPAIQTSLISELRMIVVMVWLKLNTLFMKMRSQLHCK